MSRRKNIVFMGSDAIGLPVLEYLASGKSKHFCLAGIITQPDRPTGRGKHLTPNPIQAWANNKGIQTRQPEKLGDADVEWLKLEQIDLAIVIAYGQIIKRSFLETLPLGAINLHGSLLPAYRGASPVETAVALGDKQTGVSLMRVTPKMDAGAVCDETIVRIDLEDTSIRVRKKLAEASALLLEKNLTQILNEEASFFEQEEDDVTYCRKLTKDDGWIDFNLTAIEIYNRFRAFTPWPGCMCEYNGTALKAIIAPVFQECQHTHTPGTVVQIDELGLVVAVKDGLVTLQSLQRPGGTMLPVATFINGFPIVVGSVLAGKDIFPLVGKKHFSR